MRRIVICLLSLAFCATAQAQQWHYAVFDQPDYARSIEQFVNTLGPRPDGIRGALREGRAFHLWVREDHSSNRYRWDCIRAVGGWEEVVGRHATRGSLVILGFNVEEPPCLHVLERQSGRRHSQLDTLERQSNAEPAAFERLPAEVGGRAPETGDGARFIAVQSIPTIDATSWKHFVIGGDHYLVVANYYDGRTFNIPSRIYKLGPDGFREHQSIATSGAYDWEHFVIGDRHFLAVANYYDDRSFDISSKIYVWNGQRFEDFQSVPTTGGFDMHYFRMGPEHWLGIANEVSRSADGKLRYAQNTKLYRWDGREFRYFQAISTAGAHALTAFQIDGQSYLTIAQYYEDSASGAQAYRPPLRILRWHSTQRGFVDFQSLPAAGGYDVEYFQADRGHYLAVANSYDGNTFDTESRIYRWTGKSFVAHQSLSTSNAVDLHTFTSSGRLFLAVSNATAGNKATSRFNINSHIYIWRAGRFARFQDIPTKGAYAIESFDVGGRTYLAVANSYDGKTTNVDSIIYRLDGDLPADAAPPAGGRPPARRPAR